MQNRESRAKRALQSDPHLHPLPNRERGRRTRARIANDAGDLTPNPFPSGKGNRN